MKQTRSNLGRPARVGWSLLAVLWCIAPLGCARHAVRDAGVRLTPAAPGVADPVEVRVDRAVEKLGVPGQRETARAELMRLGASAVATMAGRLEDADPEVRWELVSMLGLLSDRRATPALVRVALADPGPHLRWRSLWALQRLDDVEPAVERFVAGLRSNDATLRWNAAIALSTFGRSEGLSVLHAGLRHPSRWRRWEAINALGRVHDDRSANALAPLLQSEDRRERRETVLALGGIADERAIDLLIGALEDDDPRVRWRACMALGRAGASRAIPALLNLRDADPDPRVVAYAKRAMETIATPAG
jgi:HEAT repeat protein